MATTISVINNKGGVGKTTSTAIISELLAYIGKKVLLVDLDQQSNLSMLLNKYSEDSDEIISGIDIPEKENITELFKYRYKTTEEVIKLIYQTSINGIHIIPSSKRHKNTQLNITTNQTGNNNIILKKALNTVSDQYDFILLDNAPASDILTVNSIFASDFILTPVRVEKFSYKGLKETLDSIAYIKDEHDIQNVNFLGAFITQAEVKTNIYKDLKESYLQELQGKFFQTPIRKDVRISEVETAFQPILEFASDTNAVFDYAHLVLEMNILDEQATKTLKQCIGE